MHFVNKKILSPSRRQLKVMEAVVICGTQKEAATYLGISEQTVKNHLSTLYQRLEVGSAVEALVRLGWLNIPSNENGPRICGWIGYCSRSFNHKGYHGDMRALDIGDDGELYEGNV